MLPLPISTRPEPARTSRSSTVPCASASSPRRPGSHAFVRREGQELRIAAGTVVLCAGAYGSPAILQRSGIGGQPDLSRAGIDVVVDLPGVGGNLHDHPTSSSSSPARQRCGSCSQSPRPSGSRPRSKRSGKLRSSRASGPVRRPPLPCRGPRAQPARGPGHARRRCDGAPVARLGADQRPRLRRPSRDRSRLPLRPRGRRPRSARGRDRTGTHACRDRAAARR